LRTRIMLEVDLMSILKVQISDAAALTL
jgi:hypothetical protein